MLALRLGRGMPKEGSPSSMYSSTSEKRGRTRKPKALCSSMFCLLARGQLLRGSEHLPPLRAGPPELGDSAVDRLRHPAHGVGVLLALPFQLPVLEPLVERSGVKHHGSNCFVAVLGGVVCCSLRWRLGAPGQRKKVLRLSCSTLRGGSAIGFLSYCGASEGPFSLLQIWCSRALGKSNNFRLCIFSTYGLSSTADLQFPWRVPLD